MLGLLVKADGFKNLVSVIQNRSAGGFVNSARFHTYKTVFNNVEQTDTVLAAELVQRLDELHTVHSLAVECGRNTLLKMNGDVCGFVGSLLGRNAQLQKAGLVILGFVRGIFKVESLVRKMPEVHIFGVVGLACDFDGNVVRLGIVNLLIAGLDAPNSPRSDNLHLGSERLDGQFKTYLIVALAGAAVADSVCALFLCDFNNALSNRGTRKRSTEQITLVLCASLECGENKVVYKLVLNILDVQLGSTGFLCAFFKTGKLRVLSYVSRNADNLAAGVCFLQPRNDNRCVKSARVCQNYLFDFLSHN